MKAWFKIPPRLAHDLAPLALQTWAAFKEPQSFTWSPREWRGLRFENPLGIAGGVDKDGASIEDWWAFGPGFVEIGTVTPLPQTPNPGSIIDRDMDRLALWNKMGFPGKGAERVRANLLDLPAPRRTPVFVNIGKNRATPNERAAQDYAACIDLLADVSDAFVVNISSPNTAGLRDLFRRENFTPFLSAVTAARAASSRPSLPLFLKLSPDLDSADFQGIVDVSLECGIDGFIATNTTLAREPGMKFPAEGGVSGKPLAERSMAALRTLSDAIENASGGTSRQSPLIISVGGVMTPEDVFKRLDLGADLVQVYAALVFSGPGFFALVASSAGKRGEKSRQSAPRM